MNNKANKTKLTKVLGIVPVLFLSLLVFPSSASAKDARIIKKGVEIVTDLWRSTRPAREAAQNVGKKSEPYRAAGSAANQCYQGRKNPTERNEKRQAFRELCEEFSQP
jgi:hypothetical protein